jgi:gluconokinase
MLADMTHHSPLLVVTGVSGSGKTTLGAALAQRLRVPFADADDLHPQHNITKMSAGIPLDDHDRAPWLRAIAAWLTLRATSGGVLSCSALKRRYRDVLAAPSTRFLQLVGDIDVVRRRVAARPGHFMPPSLVASQFATLEPLEPAEHGISLDLGRGVDQLVDDCLAYLTAEPAQGARSS